MSNMPDLSSLFQMLGNKGIDVNNLAKNFSNNSSSDNCSKNPNTSKNFYTSVNSNNTTNFDCSKSNSILNTPSNSNNQNSTPSLDEILYGSSSASASSNHNFECDSINNNFEGNSANNCFEDNYTNNHFESGSASNFQMPDMETIAKIMKIMNAINSDAENPSANLLYSLKPFLRDSKKEKVDQYVKFLKISSIISEINKSGGDLK